MSDFVCSVVPLSRGPTIQHFLAKQYAQRADLPSDISMVPISTTFPPPGVERCNGVMMIEFSSFGKIHRKRAESRSKCDLRGGVGKIKTTPQKATPSVPGAGKIQRTT